MNRAQFITMLAQAIAEGWLTDEQALELMRRFDQGELTNLPLPLDAAVVIDAYEAIFTLRDIEALQDAFMEAVANVDRSIISDWQATLKRLVIGSVLANAQTGTGRTLTAEDLAELDPIMREQLAYLSRFADQMAIREWLGRPMSDAQIVARSKMYAGAGRAQWYRSSERQLDAGYVIDYVSQDDNRVCTACLIAEEQSPYLPGQGPYPGKICFGHGFCRCLRVSRYAPAAAQQLQGAGNA